MLMQIPVDMETHTFVFLPILVCLDNGIHARLGSGFYPTGPALDSHKSRHMARVTLTRKSAIAFKERHLALKESPQGHSQGCSRRP